MRKLFTFFLIALVAASISPVADAKGDDFGEVVKTVERFYHVKHKGISFSVRARAGC